MKLHRIALSLIVLLAFAAFTRAAVSPSNATDQVYRDYTEAYQKAAAAYDRSANESQVNTYVMYAVFGCVFLFLVVSGRRAQKAYMQKALAITIQNQKVLEEIRDILKKDRT